MQKIAALSLFEIQVQGYHNISFSFIDGNVHDINKNGKNKKK